jgi:hypothetical protein
MKDINRKIASTIPISANNDTQFNGSTLQKIHIALLEGKKKMNEDSLPIEQYALNLISHFTTYRWLGLYCCCCYCFDRVSLSVWNYTHTGPFVFRRYMSKYGASVQTY